jgi:uncharacterized membrane protein
MLDLFSSAGARVVILLAILLIISAVAWYVVGRFRDRDKEDETANDMMTKFREMHQRGDLTEAEYRTIKGVLAYRLQDELNHTDREG